MVSQKINVEPLISYCARGLVTTYIVKCSGRAVKECDTEIEALNYANELREELAE